MSTIVAWSARCEDAAMKMRKKEYVGRIWEELEEGNHDQNNVCEKHLFSIKKKLKFVKTFKKSPLFIQT